MSTSEVAMYSRVNTQKHRKFPRRVFAVLLVLLALLAISTLYVRHLYYQGLRPVSNGQQVLLVSIESGSSTAQIAALLHEKGLIKSAGIFEWYVRSHNVRDKLQAGTYALRPSMTLPDIVNVLVKGKVASDLVTIVPGYRLDQVRQVLINAGFEPADVDGSLSPVQYEGSAALVDKPASASLEGFLYPDSFRKDENTKANVIISESLKEMAEHLSPALRSAFAKQGLSVYEGVTLASIVEQEVPHQTDRNQVAQVFLKRLHADMTLGSDVTAFYGAIQDGKNPSTTHDSPYNTLLHKGLPPGPIGSVSESSLQAVAHPAATDWLFFVAGDDGKTYFSKTYAEHQALTKEHCKKLCGATP